MPYILTNTCSYDIDDIPDFEMKEKIQELSDEKDPSKFKDMASKFDKRFICGYNQFKINFTEKEKALKVLTRHHLISNIFEEIEQFKEGLKLGDVFDLFKKYSESAKKGEQLTADALKRMIMVSHLTLLLCA